MKDSLADRVLTDVGRLGRLLGRRFAMTGDDAPQTATVPAETRCSSSRSFAIFPGGVYELRLLVFLEGPAQGSIVPIEGQLTFLDADSERVPPEFDVHAYQAGDLSRFVVEGFAARLAQYNLDDLLVAHRYFIAPPHAREVRVELTAPVSFRVAWLECEPLIANWTTDSNLVRDLLRQHHRQRLRMLLQVLRQRDRQWSRAEAAKLAQVAATELTQIRIVTRLWTFGFDWWAVSAASRIEDSANAYYRMLSEGDDKRPAIAFIGGERLYAKLLAHFTIVLVNEAQGAGLLGQLAVKALVIESVVEDLNGEWSQAWCSVDEGKIAPLGERLLDAARQLDLPVAFYYTAAPQDTRLFRGMLERADHVFIEGDPDSYADGRLLGAEARAQFVPRTFERMLARPTRDDVRDGYGILFPCGSDLFQYPEVRRTIAALPPAATVIVEVSYDFYLRSTKFLRLRNYLFWRVFSYHEALRLLRHAGVVVLAEQTLLSAVRQQDLVLDAIGSGSVVVFIGDPSRLGGVARHVICVHDATELSEQVRLLANEFYREQRWIDPYRQICRRHAFDAVSRRLRSVILGEAPGAEAPRASMILVTKRPHLLARCIDRFLAQSYPNKELVILVNEDVAELPVRALSNESIRIFTISREYNIGYCLNAGIAAATGQFWFKVDDDDYYDAYYLEDMMNTFLYSDADTVGKRPTLFYLEASGLTVVRMNRVAGRRRSVLPPRDYLCGATLSGRSDRDLPRFSHTMRNANDTQWMDDIHARGKKMFSSSPTGFAVHRSGDKSGHTHLISDDEVLRRRENFLWSLNVVRDV